MSKFNVGDRISLYGKILEFRGRYENQEYAEFIEDKDGGNGNTYDFINSKYTGRYWRICPNEDWKLIESVKPKPKFKVGDRVRVVCDDKSYNHSNFHFGDVFVVKKLETSYFEEINNLWLWGDNSGAIGSTKVELIEEECIGFSTLTWTGDEYIKSDELLNNDKPCMSENKSRNIMSKISTFVKNSLLSADEKLLRKYGLKDECGNYTSEAFDLVEEKLAKDNEAYLIECAKGLEEEEKKNK